MFHSERWDYVYRFQPGRGEAQQRVLTVFFQDNKLTRVAGNVVAEDDSKPEAPRPAAQVIEIPGPAAAGGETQSGSPWKRFVTPLPAVPAAWAAR